MESDTTFFEFKWAEEATDVYGPYSADKMLEWQDSGYFKTGVFCRELKRVRPALPFPFFFWRGPSLSHAFGACHCTCGRIQISH